MEGVMQKIKRMNSKDASFFIWSEKYQGVDDSTVIDTISRTARFAANSDAEFESYYNLLLLYFVPGGRILSNAGTGRAKATMSNCFFVNSVPDSMKGIFKTLDESAMIMQAGGGIGLDFSLLRPKDAPVKGTGSKSSGPISFMQLWDSMCRCIESAGSRRGAQMGVMRVDHPDIDLFVGAKKKSEVGENALKMFNISVLVTDDFIDAVKSDADWGLKWDDKITKTVKARDLWDRIMRSNYYDWEPGVLFIDRINKANSLYYCETNSGTNPCGEQPLPPYNACNLGSFPLPRFVTAPFTDNAKFDFTKLAEAVAGAERFMDSIIEKNYYPLDGKIRDEVLSARRIGLGILGLTCTLSMMRIKYSTDEGRAFAAKVMEVIRDAAYSTSVELAKEYGAFPKFDAEKYLQGEFIKALPVHIREAIREHGIRNSHLLTVAPTGTTAMFCENMSSGIEGLFGTDYVRNIRISKDEEKVSFDMSPYSVELYRSLFGAELPDYITENVGTKIHYKDHILMQATVQKFIDSSISKTIPFSEDTSYGDFKEAYLFAYDMGLKGCTTYRPHSGKEGIIKEKASTEDLSKADDFLRGEIPAEILDNDLPGIRKKFKHPDVKQAYYLQFNHVEYPNGQKRPAEVFINTKNPEHVEWTTALTRMISAVMRRVPNPTFIAEELMEIQNTRTSFWNGKRRKQVPSLVAEIGHSLKDYFALIGLVEPDVPIELYDEDYHGNGNGDKPKYAYCSRCGSDTLVRADGCEFCINPKCNYNRCG